MAKSSNKDPNLETESNVPPSDEVNAKEPPVVVEKPGEAAKVMHNGIEVERITPLVTGTRQFGKNVYMLQVGIPMDVCKPLANSLVGHGEAIRC